MGPKHFLMLREFHLADVLTLGNAASGVAAILSLLFVLSGSLMISKTLRIPKI
jgi:CDP-diacylglycerol--serine O-phosphatidyltransferase